MNNTNPTSENRGLTEDTYNIVHKIQNKNTAHRTKKMRSKYPTKNPGVNAGAREGQSVITSYKTLHVLLIYKVRSGKILSTKDNYVNGKTGNPFMISTVKFV